MKKILKVYDTSALLDLSDNLVIDTDCYVSTLVINELENIKTSFNKDNDVKARARQVVRVLKQAEFISNVSNKKDIEKLMKKYSNSLPDNNDSRILLEAYDQVHWHDVHFYTGDFTLYMFGRLLFDGKYFKTHLTGDTTKKRFWDGFVTIEPTEEQWTKLYDQNNTENIFGLKINEYAF